MYHPGGARFGVAGVCRLSRVFARAVMGTNNVDHCARLCHSSSMAAMTEQLGGGSTTNAYADYERAGCLLVAGADPDTNHPVIAARLRAGVAVRLRRGPRSRTCSR